MAAISFSLILATTLSSMSSPVNAEHSTSITVVSDTSVSVEELNNNAVIVNPPHVLWPTLTDAKYIWATTDGNSLVDTLGEFGPWTFTKSLDVPSGYEDCTGSIKITADNTYKLYVNEVFLGEDGDLTTVETYALSELQTGTNEIKIVAVNLEPERVDPYTNPAMVLFRAEITCAGVHDSTPPPSETDSTPPEITVPDPITVQAEGPEGAAVTFDVSAEDDVDGPVDVICDPESGSTFPIGETTVECSATDASENTGIASLVVTVQ